MDFDEGIHAVDVAVTEAVQLIGEKTMRGTNPDEASETGESEDLEVRPVRKRLRCIWLHLWNIWYMVAVLLRAVRGIVRSMVIVAIMILLLVQTGQAEEAGYELLWSYETGGSVNGVISSDGSYIAAGSDDNKVYLFNRDGELLWSYETGQTGHHVSGVSISSDGSYIAVGSFGSPVYLLGDAERFSSSAIAGAKKSVELEKSKGFNMDKAKNLLSKAEDAFDSGDYSKAFELADQAKLIALDIDGDGTPNDADFAPTINNYLIYAGAAILLVGLVIAIRRRSKARQLEEERRIRAEEEKRRVEEAERQRREEAKQRILDKIKEAT